MAMQARRTMLSDAQWERIEPLCAGKEGDVGRTGTTTGASWRRCSG